MNRNRITVRYAKALFELCSEQGNIEEVDADIRLLHTVLDKTKGFNLYLTNQGNNTKKKLAAIEAIFGNDFHSTTNKFIALIFESRREEYLKDICRNFIFLVRGHFGIKSATLSTAIELDEETISQIKMKFEEELAAKIELVTEQNPDLLGGFVLTIDGNQYDASLSSKIESIKKHLHLTN